MILWKLFLSFLKIGAFTIGGGYAMIPLIENEMVVRHSWLTRDEFMDMVVISQTAPGLLAINLALMVGHHVAGRKGAYISALASALPSFVAILLIAMFLENFQEHPYFQAAFKALRPAVVALIAVPMWNMAQRSKLNRYTAWIPVAGALLISYAGLSPLWVVFLGGLGGIIVTYFRQRKLQKEGK